MILRFAKSLLYKLHQVYKEQQDGLTPDHAMLWDVIFDLHDYFDKRYQQMLGWRSPGDVSEQSGIQYETTGETTLEAYGNRLTELAAAMKSQDERKMMIAIDNAVNTFHRQESALSHWNIEQWRKDRDVGNNSQWLNQEYLDLIQFLHDQGKTLNPQMFEEDLEIYQEQDTSLAEGDTNRIDELLKKIRGEAQLRFAADVDWAFLLTPENTRIDMPGHGEHEEAIVKYWGVSDESLLQLGMNELRAEFLNAGGAQVRYVNVHGIEGRSPQMAIRYDSKARSLKSIVDAILQGKYPMGKETSVWIADEGSASQWKEHSVDLAGLLDA